MNICTCRDSRFSFNFVVFPLAVYFRTHDEAVQMEADDDEYEAPQPAQLNKLPAQMEKLFRLPIPAVISPAVSRAVPLPCEDDPKYPQESVLSGLRSAKFTLASLLDHVLLPAAEEFAAVSPVPVPAVILMPVAAAVVAPAPLAPSLPVAANRMAVALLESDDDDAHEIVEFAPPPSTMRPGKRVVKPNSRISNDFF